MEKTKEEKWILIRDEEVTNTFKNRKEAVKYFIELLEQTLKDFKRQNKTNEYNYPIQIPEIEIKPVKWRESYLSLL